QAQAVTKELFKNLGIEVSYLTGSDGVRRLPTLAELIDEEYENFNESGLRLHKLLKAHRDYMEKSLPKTIVPKTSDACCQTDFVVTQDNSSATDFVEISIATQTEIPEVHEVSTDTDFFVENVRTSTSVGEKKNSQFPDAAAPPNPNRKSSRGKETVAMQRNRDIVI
ncbi:hypothetical protein JGH00_23095, partial [Salmonella enterica subsp. enterica serovar London]|nr:hypothetical protein [Salmonella enterica subsp. enterica serovar London]